MVMNTVGGDNSGTGIRSGVHVGSGGTEPICDGSGTRSMPINVEGTGGAMPTLGGRGQVNDGDTKNVWNYGFKLGQGFKCGFCGHVHKSGGATRLREHLGGIPGDVIYCKKVSSQVREAMRIAHSMGKKKRLESKKLKMRLENDLVEEMGGNPISEFVPSDEEGQVRLAMERSVRDHRHGRGSTTASGHGSCSLESREHVSIQPRIDIALNKGTMDKLGQAWARWFHANDIPGIKANCPYFRAAMRLTQQHGPIGKLFTGSDIDGPHLEENYKDVELMMGQFKKDWKQYGVTLMCDSWTGPTSMSIIKFMVYCNGRILFHKAVDATGEIQNADFLHREIEKVVVDEIGHNCIVQIVTDNGSNYKKACAKLIDEYRHIIWQPCAAHTSNLMLKDIGKFSEVEDVVSSAKRISKFFYNHNRLHNEMKKTIGGELIRPNATRFGIVFVFLQSFWDRKDKFRQWMVSEEWRNSDGSSDLDYDYVEGCLISTCWWDSLKSVLDVLQPLYVVLRYADEDNGTLSGFMPKMMSALKDMENYLGVGSQMYKRYMQKVTKRVHYLYNNTLIVAAAVLDPVGHYYLHLSDNYDYCNSFQEAIERIQDSVDSGLQALTEFESFKNLGGKLGGNKSTSEEDDITLEQLYTRMMRRKHSSSSRKDKSKKGKMPMYEEEDEFMSESDTGSENTCDIPSYAEFDEDSEHGEDSGNHEEEGGHQVVTKGSKKR